MEKLAQVHALAEVGERLEEAHALVAALKAEDAELFGELSESLKYALDLAEMADISLTLELWPG